MRGSREIRRIISIILVIVMIIVVNLATVSAATQTPGKKTTQTINVPTISGQTYTKDNYIEKLAEQGALVSDKLEDIVQGKNIDLVPVVWDPIPDGVDMRPHPELGNQTLADIGVIDVTAAPFYADPTGVSDSTTKIQQAIEYGISNQLVVFFPEGTYTVSDTLWIHSGITLRTPMTFIANKNEIPTVLVGSRKGNGVKIKLADNAPGFNNPDNAKSILQYHQPRIDSNDIKNSSGAKIGTAWAIKWGEHASNLEGNIMVAHLTIETGNNPGAIGINMASAEGAVLQDVNVNATGSLCGMLGGSGNGGSWTNINVTGGKIGIDMRKQVILVPQMQNVTLTGQTHAAMLAGTQGTTVITGLKIEVDYSGPAIIQRKMGQPYFGSLNIIDSEIRYNNPYDGPAIAGTASQITLESVDPASDEIPPIGDLPKGLYLNNVYFKNVSQAVYGSQYAPLSGNLNGWIQVKEYATGRDENWTPKAGGPSYQFYNPAYVDKTKVGNTYINGTTLNVEPPIDLQLRHSWAPNQIPNFETEGIVNVKTTYGAKGDGMTDDTEALQKAINENDLIFLPKGYYRISNTLTLRPNTKLFGISEAFSTIYTRPEDFLTGKPFSNPANPRPLVQTADVADANTIISDIAICTPREVPKGFGNMSVYSVKWQSGGNSLIRSLFIRPFRVYGFIGNSNFQSGTLEHPIFQVTGNGGGRIYNVFVGLFSTPMLESMRNLTIKGTSNPLVFYATEWQYITSTGSVDIRDSKYVTFYGIKAEGNTTYFDIKDSDHIRIFGNSGNMSGPYDGSWINTQNKVVTPNPIDISKKGDLFRVQNVPNFLFTNMAEQVSADPTRMTGLNIIKTRYDLFWPLTVDGIHIPSEERPVLYKLGNPAGSFDEMEGPSWTNGSLTASNETQTTLTLSWSGANDNVGITGYKVYQGSKLIATLGNVTSYDVTSLDVRTEYTFKVEAGDAAGNWSASGPSVTVSTLSVGGGNNRDKDKEKDNNRDKEKEKYNNSHNE